ncbi:MAG: ATP-binding cassette domain-containing protein [Pseudomonadota bacterium]
MIKLSNIALRRGTQLLFERVSLDLHPGEKIGLVGDNGTGKSSLFDLIRGELHSDTGDITLPPDLRISHVAQETPSSDQSALDYVLDGDAEFRNVQTALDRAQHDGERSAALFAKMDEIDGYSAPSKAAKLLSGLGFPAEHHGSSTRSFSGGWRVRLNLAQALMKPSDLLLLDEPTNHLDLDAIVWLEEWLKKYSGTLMVISHDRDFIDGACKRILHIDNCGIRTYSGNYTQFERTRAERLSNEQALFERQQKKIAHMESFIKRFRYKASKAKQAQSRIKALEKLQQSAPAHSGSPFQFEFGTCDRLSDPVVKMEAVDAGYDGNAVLKNVNLSLSGGDRIGLLGANGAGKSTLIKLIEGEILPMTGGRQKAKHLTTGYFAQHQLELLDPNLSPMQQFQKSFPAATPQEIRNFLGGFNFQGDRVDELIGPFSGGEKARLVLAMIIYSRPNLLLLDEPTNHLDMEMRHALTVAMQSYEGAIILVSHDRSLLNAVTDDLVLIQNSQVTPFKDDINAYLRLLRQKTGQGADPQGNASASRHNDSLTKKQKRQQTAQKRAQLKPARDRIRELERSMEKLGRKISELDSILQNPETYETESTARLAKLMQDKSALEGDLSKTESGWYAAAEELENLERELVSSQ